MNALQKIRQQTDVILAAENGLKIEDAWTLLSRLLPRTPADPAEVARVLKAKDNAGLDAIVRGLENPQAAAPSATEPSDEGISADPHEMDRALKAFRKRMKLGRLADESRLGGRYTSGGRKSAIDAIVPPDGFEDAVWKALAREGRLVSTGHGMYALPADDPSNKPEPPAFSG